ncbi:MAG: hypothetical protein AB1428_13080 [Bacteroidota bacterium]
MIDLDVDEFLDPDLTIDAVYTRGTITKTIPVIFDREYSLATIGDVPVQMAGPKLLCKSADVTGIDTTATFTIDGVVYKVTDPRPDVNGFTEVFLTRD